jgi:hypothetical protein
MERDNNYRLLIQKLDQFIRKYYVNKMIRGGLYSVGLVLLLFLIINIVEYYDFYYSNSYQTLERKILWYSFLAISIGALAQWVLRPLMSYFHLGQVISHERAAQIIGQHFTDVKDKLLNVLQLKKQADQSGQQDLIMASINQKTEDIKLVPFKSAINLSQNRKYLRFALPPLLLFLLVLFAAPSLIKDSTTRLINNNKVFEKPAPFSFVLDEQDLNVVQYEDYDLLVKIEGDQLPDEAFIELDNASFRLKKVDKNLFSYQFKTVQKAIDFKLSSGAVQSKKYELEVLKKPNILGFEVKLDYPAYTGRQDEDLANIGDIVVPAGTNISWIFNAENTDDIQIRFSDSDSLEKIKRFSDELFTYKKRALQDNLYKLYVSNELLPQADSVSYSLSVIPDLYPTIGVEKFQDSLDNKLLYFVGEASDDYGLSLLTFNYRKKGENQAQGTELATVPLGRPSGKQTEFDHVFDLNELNLKPGDQITYFFEIFDNDGVNGVKSARTNLMLFAMPTLDEYEAMAEENDEKIKDELQKALSESRKIQEDMKKMREKLLQQKELDWQDRKELEKMLERQKELEKQIEEAKKAFEENLKNQEEFSQADPETMEKQEKLQQLFEEVMSEEMQELMKKIEQLMQELEKDQAIEMMEESEFNNEEIEKEIDRLLELFKQLEMEQEMQKTIDQLQELAQEQEELQKETEEYAENPQEEEKAFEEEQKNKEEEKGEENKENKEKGEENKEQNQQSEENKEGQENQEKKDNQQNQEQNQNQDNKEQENKEQQNQDAQQQPQNKQEELQQKQEDINKKFEEVQEQMKNMEEKNEELENPMNMEDQQQEMQDIEYDLNQSQQQLQQKQNNKASKSQKNAAQKMKQMAQNMQQQMQSSQMEQMQEDMKALRQLLENLVGLSFDQEELMDEFTKTASTTPKYVELVQEQFKLKDDFRLIEDSLQALSKRVFQIESFVTEKVTEINGNMASTVEDLEERKKLRASDHQQRVMKNTNDLALMLSEVMNQMQQQMSSMMKGQQMCSNPQQGQQGGQPQDKISEGQRKLNEQMHQMKKGMEEGGGITSEEYARMAARQAALRKALEEKQKKLREQGQGNKELQELMNKMDQVEKDLVNKQLANETLMRQQEILTRLLQHERAERQREFDEQRKSKTAQETEKRMPPALEEYIKKRKSEIELYRTVSPSLKPYYKNLVEEYFKSLKSEK